MKTKLKQNLIVLMLLLCTLSGYAQPSKFKVLNYIYRMQGAYTFSGQHNDQKNLECSQLGSGSTNASYWTEKVKSITGKYPAFWSGDFLFNGDGQPRWDITYEAEKQYNAGAIVQLMWHNCPPTQGSGACGWDGGVKSSLTSAQWTQLLTDGSSLNKQWKSNIDVLKPYFQYLKNANIEVLWRPYHEQNQTVFWWNSGGAANTKALWIMMHNYITCVDNIVYYIMPINTCIHLHPQFIIRNIGYVPMSIMNCVVHDVNNYISINIKNLYISHSVKTNLPYISNYSPKFNLTRHLP